LIFRPQEAGVGAASSPAVKPAFASVDAAPKVKVTYVSGTGQRSGGGRRDDLATLPPPKKEPARLRTGIGTFVRAGAPKKVLLEPSQYGVGQHRLSNTSQL